MMQATKICHFDAKRGGAVALPLAVYGQGPRVALVALRGPCISSRRLSHYTMLAGGLQASSQRRSPLGGTGGGRGMKGSAESIVSRRIMWDV